MKWFQMSAQSSDPPTIGNSILGGSFTQREGYLRLSSHLIYDGENPSQHKI